MIWGHRICTDVGADFKMFSKKGDSITVATAVYAHKN